nr:unnamed protein product [Callosobruchus analis]
MELTLKGSRLRGHPQKIGFGVTTFPQIISQIHSANICGEGTASAAASILSPFC